VRRSENITEYFDRTAAAFAANYRSSAEFLERQRVWQRAVEKILPSFADRLLCLDLGCGDGSLSRFLAERQFKIVGIDQSDKMLAMARYKAVERNVSGYAQYIRASLPLSSDLEQHYLDSADIILCSSVLEYLEDPEEVLRQFSQLLAPGGVVLISLPNRFSFYRVCERALSGILRYTDSYVRHQRHQLILANVKQALNRLGLLIIDEILFALPFQRYTQWLFGNHRGNRVATMVLVVAKKPRQYPTVKN